MKIKNNRSLFFQTSFISFMLIALASCASHNQYQLPLTDETVFSPSGSEVLSEPWWESLANEKLNTHIETALSNNFSLEAAWERLQAARAISTSLRSDLYPKLDVKAGVSRVNGESTAPTSQYTLGPAASYEVDLWGSIRAAADASSLRALASESAYRSAALSLSGDVALTWVRYIEAHKQLRLLKQQTATNEKVLKILKTRFQTGQVRSEDILRQQLLIEAIREDILGVEIEYLETSFQH